ncbi:MAG: hypothetical protein U1E18_24915 [Brevundimonas sp.]|uniref:hypothetical protein n=1 Tax=Brevundimonas sp. TaxID=1871086 RepID=UPI002ABA1998|nr:hypothetical protein [Brevundimonas sp.]MDZ4112820.1 hypothetical protein [Brevundimonas sp.]
MITLMAGVALLALGAPDPQDPDETIRTATVPGVSAETVAAEGEAAAGAEADAPTLIVEQDPEPHGLTTDQQISRWMAAAPAVSPGADVAYDGPVDGVGWDNERRVRGEISAGVGTGGYRQYGASVSVPLGESGQLDLQYNEVKNGYPAYGGYGYGYDPAWMDPEIAPWRSEIGAASMDAGDRSMDRRRAYRDYGRTRPAPESGR